MAEKTDIDFAHDIAASQNARAEAAEARLERLEIAIGRIFRDRREADKVCAECLSVRPELVETARDRIATKGKNADA